ncbi:TPA: superoxide dismutase, partial [Legionella pneumophila subsp. pneumophila]|nr:superoxide dismutase [Legionella pneumophila subsp. pneumophila]
LVLSKKNIYSTGFKKNSIFLG